jgi:hypothetical protein
MKNYFVTLIVACALTASFFIIRQKSQAQNAGSQRMENMPSKVVDAAAATANAPTIGSGATSHVTDIPPGYRDWRLISVARELGELDDIRAILGNDIAINAYRGGTRPFPEGAIIARIAWGFVPSEENNNTFGTNQSFVAGAPKNGVQFMVKDSKKYAATGGWGYGQFGDGKFAGASMLKSCFPCHEAFKDQDYIFTHYAP